MTEARTALGRPARTVGRAVELLDRPALGLDPIRSALGLGVAAAVVAVVVVAGTLEWVHLSAVDHWLLAEFVDGLRWLSVFLAPLTWPVAFGYALWNGGPVVAVAIAASAETAAAITRWQVVLSSDLVAATVVASAAATIALVVTVRGLDGGYRPSSAATVENGLLVASSAFAVAAVCYGRVLTADTPATVEWVRPLGLVLAVLPLVLVPYWWDWIRAVRREGLH